MKLNQLPLTNNMIDYYNIDLANTTFYTKEEFNGVLVNEDMYEIVHLLKYNYKNGIDNSEYIEKLKSKNFDLNFLKNTLIFMISRGIPQAVLLKNDFEIDTSDINIDIFLEGFINGMNGLEDSELLGDYVKLYKDSQELLEAIGKKGDITLLSNLIYYYGLDFKKFNDEQIDIILSGFKYNLNKSEFSYKINTIGSYNWFIICSELFENYELAYSKIQDIFDLTEDEKEKFEEFKQSHFFTSYQSEIQNNIESFEDINFQKINEFTYNDTFEENINFQNKVRELLVGLNAKNGYSFVFLDISGRKEQLNIGNGLELDGYNYNLLEKESYSDNLSEIYGDFKLNLNKNNMDFTILIFKLNGDKDDTPDELYEELKIAA